MSEDARLLGPQGQDDRAPLDRRNSAVDEDLRARSKSEHELMKTMEHISTRKQLYLSVFLVMLWLGVGGAVYSFYYHWPYASALYYSAQAGLSIGFGALSEPDDQTRLYTIFHILMGSSFIGGAVGIFVTNTLEKHDMNWEEERENRLAELEQQSNTATEQQSNTATEHEQSAKERGETLNQSDQNLPLVNKKQKKSWYEENKTDVRLWAIVVLWLAMGITYGIAVEGWTFIQSFYFCITAWSTAGLQAPTVETEGSSYATWTGIFLTIFVTAGVPIYGMVLGQYANKLVDQYLANAQAAKVQKHFDASQIEYARSLAANKNKIEFDAFLQVSLIRLGVADESLVKSIKKQFNNMDFDGDGYLEMEELIAAMRFGCYDIGRNNHVEKSGFILLFDDLSTHNTYSQDASCVMYQARAPHQVWTELCDKDAEGHEYITLANFQAFYNFVSDHEKFDAWNSEFGQQWLQGSEGVKMPLIFKDSKQRLDKDEKLLKQKQTKLMHFLRWTRDEANKKWLDGNLADLKTGTVELPDEAFHMKQVEKQLNTKVASKGLSFRTRSVL